MPKRDLSERNKTIATQLDGKVKTAPELSEEFGISREQVYRAAQQGRLDTYSIPLEAVTGKTVDLIQPAGVGDVIPPKPLDPAQLDPQTDFVETRGRSMFDQNAKSGLRRFGGRVDDDYSTLFRNYLRRIQLYREMGDDPIVAAVLQAIKMTLRRVNWFVEPKGDNPVDKLAAQFLYTAMHDMSQPWTDIIDNAMGMAQYGFQLAEIDYKKRQGLNPAGDAPASKYDDGRIGWRKLVFIAPESLAPGREWVFDDYGGIQGFVQQAPPEYRPVAIPMIKAILFRITTEKGNPESRSILRAMYSAYWYKKNLEEIQAIAFERNGMGLPTFYLGKDVGKNAQDNDSDITNIKKIANNLRVDEQASLVLPFSKMGAGAAEGMGVLFEFSTAAGVDFSAINDAIVRYEQRMSMVGLAQFIHLGMTKIGTQALSRTMMDFFTLAVSAWADSLEDTLNRFMVERLFALNAFPGLTDYPRLRHERVGTESLTDIADYLQKLGAGGFINPDGTLQDFLRDQADLPQKDDSGDEGVVNAPASTGDLGNGQTTQPNPQAPANPLAGPKQASAATTPTEKTALAKGGTSRNNDGGQVNPVANSQPEQRTGKVTPDASGGANAGAEHASELTKLTQAAEMLSAEIRKAKEELAVKDEAISD